MELKSVGIWSCGKIIGAMYFLMGLLLGGFMAMVSVLGIAIDQQQGNAAGNPMAAFAATGVAAVVLIPILYGVIGLIGGIIAAAIYNLLAGLFGGIEMNLEPRAQDVQY